MVVWGLGFLGLGLGFGFWGWCFQLMGFRACGGRSSVFFWVGALYINKRVNLGNKT